MTIKSRSKEMTTIKVARGTLLKLNKLKVHERQSYEEVLLSLIKKKKNILKYSFSSLGGDVTTLKISKDSQKNLCDLKIHKRQSYEEIIQALLA